MIIKKKKKTNFGAVERDVSVFLAQRFALRNILMNLSKEETISYPAERLWGRGDRGCTVVKVLCHKSEGRWFHPRWCH